MIFISFTVVHVYHQTKHEPYHLQSARARLFIHVPTTASCTTPARPMKMRTLLYRRARVRCTIFTLYFDYTFVHIYLYMFIFLYMYVDVQRWMVKSKDGTVATRSVQTVNVRTAEKMIDKDIKELYEKEGARRAMSNEK